MNQPIRPSLQELLADEGILTQGIGRGVRAALLKRIAAGQPVAAWRDGQAVWLSPEEALALLDAAATKETPPPV